MALPAILGVGAITGLITSLVSKLVTKLAAAFTKDAAVMLAIISAYIALLVALASLIASLLSGISVALPPELSQGLGMFKPDNFEICISAIYSTKIALWVFNQKKQFLDWQVAR